MRVGLSARFTKSGTQIRRPFSSRISVCSRDGALWILAVANLGRHSGAFLRAFDCTLSRCCVLLSFFFMNGICEIPSDN